MITIKLVGVDEILPLRHKVLWPSKAIDFCKLPEDASGLHYGLFLDGKLVSCISAFIDERAQEAQFRKFAADQEHQGKGFGTLLLQALMRELKSSGISLLWCNARISATGFYERLGFATDGDGFVKDEVHFVKMQRELRDFSASPSSKI